MIEVTDYLTQKKVKIDPKHILRVDKMYTGAIISISDNDGKDIQSVITEETPQQIGNMIINDREEGGK